MTQSSPYPSNPGARTGWILAHRPARQALDPFRPQHFFIEEERTEEGQLADVATVFLTNRECPWRCLMCDLWKHTLPESVPSGAIPAQIDVALASLPTSAAIPGRSRPAQIKLYNSGSFFDPHAVPPEDYLAIAQRVCPFDRVIVECHPALIGKSCLEFQEMLRAAAASNGRTDGKTPQLEIALGLETAHAETLEKLNKRMTLAQFSDATRFLQAHSIAIRVFILVKPPFQTEAEAQAWAKKSLEFAFESGATAVALIPTRLGNGALDALEKLGSFSPPKLHLLEGAQAYGIGLRKGRVFADLWDLKTFSSCDVCFPDRYERLRAMNRQQTVLPPIPCSLCQGNG